MQGESYISSMKSYIDYITAFKSEIYIIMSPCRHMGTRMTVYTKTNFTEAGRIVILLTYKNRELQCTWNIHIYIYNQTLRLFLLIHIDIFKIYVNFQNESALSFWSIRKMMMKQFFDRIMSVNMNAYIPSGQSFNVKYKEESLWLQSNILASSSSRYNRSTYGRYVHPSKKEERKKWTLVKMAGILAFTFTLLVVDEFLKTGQSDGCRLVWRKWSGLKEEKKGYGQLVGIATALNMVSLAVVPCACWVIRREGKAKRKEVEEIKILERREGGGERNAKVMRVGGWGWTERWSSKGQDKTKGFMKKKIEWEFADEKIRKNKKV